MVSLVWYLVLASINVLFTLVSILFANWWAPIFSSNNGWLPKWLCWLQTFDNSLDAGWIYDNPPFKTDGKPTRWQRYWLRVRWLNRNPAYGFCYWPLGRKFDPAEWTVIADEVSPARELFYARGPNGAFNWRYHGQWGQYKLGWKAANYYSPGFGWTPDYQWGPEMRVPICFTVIPWNSKK